MLFGRRGFVSMAIWVIERGKGCVIVVEYKNALLTFCPRYSVEVGGDRLFGGDGGLGFELDPWR